MTDVRRTLHRRGWGALAVVGAGLLVGSAALAAHDRPPADFGRLPVATVPSGSPRTLSLTTKPASATAGQVTTAPPTVAVTGPAPPSTVTIPALGVRASVLPVHAANGVLGVPDDPRDLGWWADGTPVGSPVGTVVLDGHVDSAVSGEGALFDLTRLNAGDAVLVATASGRTDRFVVKARRTYRKAEGLPAEVFRADGPPRLVLITCGGPFDRTARSYLDNIVVFASPAT